MNLKLCSHCQYGIDFDIGIVSDLSQDTPFAMEQEQEGKDNYLPDFKSWLCLRCLHYESNYPEGAVVQRSNQKIIIKCIHCPYYLYKQQNQSLKEKLFTCPCCNWHIKIDVKTNTLVADPKTFTDERIAWFLDRYKKMAQDNYRDEVISTILFEENSSSEFRDLEDWIQTNYLTPDSNS